VSLIVLLLVLAATTGLSDRPADLPVLLGLEFGVFASIALHELGHAFIAIRKGCRVREITLLFIGGAAQMESIPKRPRDEFQMAIAGPAVSIALGLLCWFGGARLPLAEVVWPLPFFRSLGIVCNLVQFIGVVNWGLALFNLLPAFPMDGGRILRALLTSRMGRLRATSAAARVGKILALVMGVRGVLQLAHGGWVLIVVAILIHTVAEREYRLVQLQEIGWHPGVPPWWPFGPPREPPPRDRVTISPPPYEKGPDQQADLRTDDER
jgi:stage IV sporulation protein FB